jgi:hypothetical protein
MLFYCTNNKPSPSHTNFPFHFAEESLKRQTANHGQIAFNYDSVDTAASTTVKNEDSNDVDNEEDLEPFVPPHNFDIPIDMEQPDSMKLHAIIEKTARFISGQGAQMEILLKAKQANNRQFDFLNQDCKYFNYYRHVLSAMKNNCYPVLEETNEAESKGETSFLLPCQLGCELTNGFFFRCRG